MGGFWRYPNMLDDIRNFLGDMISGKTKDAHLALTKEQAEVFKVRLDEAVEENESLRDEVRGLTEALTESQSRIQQLQQETTMASPEQNERLHEKQEQILKLLHESEELSVEQLAESISLSSPDTKFHVDKLSEEEFIKLNLNSSININRTIRQSPLVSARRGRNAAHSQSKSLGVYYIKPKGREYVVTKMG